jgi:hypothetical protein
MYFYLLNITVMINGRKTRFARRERARVCVCGYVAVDVGVCTCGCFGNKYLLCFVLFCLCIFIFICFVCTSVRTTDTE